MGTERMREGGVWGWVGGMGGFQNILCNNVQLTREQIQKQTQ